MAGFFMLLLVVNCCLQAVGAEWKFWRQVPLQVSYSCNSIIGPSTANMTLKCTIEVLNTGIESLYDLAVWIGDPVSRTSVAKHCAQKALSANDSYICSFIHPLTQAEIDSGKWSSVAKASGSNDDEEYYVKKSKKVTVTWAQTPMPDLQMSITPLVGTTALPDKTTATFTILVKNVGVVSIKSAKLSDTTLSVKCNQKLKNIAPRSTVTCTATYVIEQGDMDLGIVAKSACVKGRGPKRFGASHKACASAYLVLTQPGKKTKEL